MPGYCVAGTIGHKVLSGAKKIEIDKKMVNVRLSVQYMSFRWANLFNQFLQIKKIILVLWMLTCYMYVYVLCMCIALSYGRPFPCYQCYMQKSGSGLHGDDWS